MMVDGSKSRFDFGRFYDGYDEFAVNSCKYTEQEAIEIYKNEMGLKNGEVVSIASAFVRHRVGINGDCERCVGWWLEYEEHKTSCPVYAMHLKTLRNENNFRYKHFIV